MNLLVFFYFSVGHESLMDRQVFNWTQTIYKKATKVFKNCENLERMIKCGGAAVLVLVMAFSSVRSDQEESSSRDEKGESFTFFS